MTPALHPHPGLPPERGKEWESFTAFKGFFVSIPSPFQGLPGGGLAVMVQ